jgi:hypothetical protein
MPVTYKKIASVTVGAGGTATIQFTSIPSTYTDLILLTSLRNSTTAGGAKLTINGSSTGYSERILYGTGSTAASGTKSTSWIEWSTDANTSSMAANTFSNGTLYIPNYSGSTNKSISSEVVVEDNATYGTQYMNAALWSNTAAITSLTITSFATTFVQYSTATLYGISKS